MLTISAFHYRLKRLKQVSRVVFAMVALAGFACTGSLAAQTIDTINTSGTNNVVVSGSFAYAAAGGVGLIVVDLDTLQVVNAISPPGTSNTIDDVSIDGDLLFTLDASGAGAISAFSVTTPQQPTLVSGPVGATVSPFAGISAANGRVVVSGGTGLLSVRNYDSTGNISGIVSQIDLGIGQPDVLISNDGDTGYVSTDFAGSFDGSGFGISVIDISSPPTTLLDRVGIIGAGFSPGVSGPANFPIESAIQGNTLYVASGNGVVALDISNPNSLSTLATIPLSTNPVNIDAVGDTLYVVGNVPTNTLTTIDVSNLSSPVIQTQTLPAAGNPLGVAATASHVVVADSNLGLVVETLPVASADFVPSSVSLFRGILVAGGLADVINSDDADLQVNPGFTLTSLEPPIAIEMESNVGTASLSELTLTVEASVNTPGLSRITQVFNFSTGTYDDVDTIPGSFNVDLVNTVDLSSSIADYVDTDGSVNVRPSWMQNGFTLIFPWRADVDNVFWTATQ